MSAPELLRRIEALESSQRRWRFVALAALALGACGGVTSHYEKCYSQSFLVERGSNGGAVLARLGESSQGGRFELFDAQGKVRVVIDADGVRTVDAVGKEKWASPRLDHTDRSIHRNSLTPRGHAPPCSRSASVRGCQRRKRRGPRVNFFNRLFGRDAASPTSPGPDARGGGPVAALRRWDDLDDEARKAARTALLERVASRAGLEKPRVHVPRGGDDVELRATARGVPLRVELSWSGGVEVEFKYASRVGFIDLEYAPAEDDDDEEPWSESDRRVLLAPRIFVDGSSCNEEAAAFRRLPGPLQARVLDAIARLGIRYFRSRPSVHTVMAWKDLKDMPDPEAWLVEAIALSSDVIEARLGGRAAPPGHGGAARPFSAVEGDEDATWGAAEAYLARLALGLPGARVVPRREEDEIDLRWTEAGVPVRVVLDVDASGVRVGALADGVEAELSLLRDPDATLDEPASDDPWAPPPETKLFLSRDVFLSGTEAATRREAAVLDRLPRSLLDELVAAMERHDLSDIDLEAGQLLTFPCDLVDLDEDGATVIGLARLLSRVAAALPRGTEPAPRLSPPPRCQGCGSLWFSGSGRATCARCGGPSGGLLLLGVPCLPKAR
jgi:hypothetical protein